MGHFVCLIQVKKCFFFAMFLFILILSYVLDQPDIQRISDSHNAKRKIATYQLWKSQLAFTLAEQRNRDPFPTPISHTTVISEIMTDEITEKRS